MNKIANIVTTAKKHNYSTMFNVVSSIDDIIDGLPTLIVGWNNVKKIYPNADILSKDVDGVYWTFSKTERRCDYEEDVIKFYETAILGKMKDVKYVYVDIPKFSLNSIKKVIKFLKDDTNKTVFITKGSKFMFVYSQTYNTVFGISLTMCEFIGVDKRKVINMVTNGEFIRDTSFINSDIRRVISTNTHYILPLHDYFQ